MGSLGPAYGIPQAVGNSTYGPLIGTLDSTTAPVGNVTVGTVMGRIPFALSHGAFPSLVKLANGTILCAFRGGTTHSSGDGQGYLASSTNNGRTWSTPAVFIPNVGMDIRDPNITLLSNGTLVSTYSKIDVGTGDSTGVYVTRSTDSGVTWGAEITVGFTFDVYAFVSMPVVQNGDGSLVLAAYIKTVAGGIYTYAKTMRSTDLGLTWGNEVMLADGLTDTRAYQEPNLTLLSDGTLRAFIRTESVAPYVIRTATSADGGLTWSANTVAFNGNGNPHVLRYAGTSILTVVYRDETTQYAGVITSRDNGATWSTPQIFGVATSKMTYGAMVETSPGVSLCVWAREDTVSTSWLHTVYFATYPGVSPFGSPVPSPSFYTPAPLVQSQISQRFIPGSTLLSSSGTPVMTSNLNTGAGGAWVLPDGATSGITSLLDLIPAWWKTFSVDVWWAPLTATAGNVRFDMSWGFYTGGTVLTGGTYVSGAANVAASPASSFATATKNLVATITNVPTRVPYLRLLRAGAAAEDTYPDGAAILGLMLKQLT